MKTIYSRHPSLGTTGDGRNSGIKTCDSVKFIFSDWRYALIICYQELNHCNFKSCLFFLNVVTHQENHESQSERKEKYCTKTTLVPSAILFNVLRIGLRNKALGSYHWQYLRTVIGSGLVLCIIQTLNRLNKWNSYNICNQVGNKFLSTESH